MNIELSRLAAVVVVTLSLASIACSKTEASAAPAPAASNLSLVDGVAANAIGDIKAPVVTKCIRTYTGSCDSFKVSCKRSGGSLAGSCPGDNGELFCWT